MTPNTFEKLMALKEILDTVDLGMSEESILKKIEEVIASAAIQKPGNPLVPVEQPHPNSPLKSYSTLREVGITRLTDDLDVCVEFLADPRFIKPGCKVFVEEQVMDCVGEGVKTPLSPEIKFKEITLKRNTLGNGGLGGLL